MIIRILHDKNYEYWFRFSHRRLNMRVILGTWCSIVPLCCTMCLENNQSIDQCLYFGIKPIVALSFLWSYDTDGMHEQYDVTSVKAIFFKLLKFLLYHMVITSEALGTCERLAQGHYSAMRRPGVEPMTCWLHVQHPNHYTTATQSFPSHKLVRWSWSSLLYPSVRHQHMQLILKQKLQIHG